MGCSQAVRQNGPWGREVYIPSFVFLEERTPDTERAVFVENDETHGVTPKV